MIEVPSAVLRKAKMSDAVAIQRLVTIFALRDEMLHRSLDEVIESLRNFFVVEVDEPVPLAAPALDENELPMLSGAARLELPDPEPAAGTGSIVACGALQMGWGN